MLSRLKGRGLTWFFFFLWIFVLVVWAWSTGWRDYLIMADIPVLLFMILVLLFIYWMDAKYKMRNKWLADL